MKAGKITKIIRSDCGNKEGRVLEDKISVHEKGSGENIYVYINEYKGTKYLHIREWYLDAKDNERKPTKKGVTLPLEKIEALLEAIKKLKE
jgi:hypothetical protein